MSAIMVPAYTSLIGCGLRVYTPSGQWLVVRWQRGGVELALVLDSDDEDEDDQCWVPDWRGQDELTCDLRDADTRDRALRALYACVLPGERRAPFSAPCWLHSHALDYIDSQGRRVVKPWTWRIEHPDGTPCIEWSTESLPALAEVDTTHEDRDLSALAIVLAAVMGVG